MEQVKQPFAARLVTLQVCYPAATLADLDESHAEHVVTGMFGFTLVWLGQIISVLAAILPRSRSRSGF
jgi:hypothetical protein